MVDTNLRTGGAAGRFTLPVLPASQTLCLCSLTENGDERAQTESQGRQALAPGGRRSLAAVSVRGGQALLSARHGSGAVLGCVRLSSGASSTVALVAVVRLAVACRHWLAPVSTYICGTRLRAE
jgi:hypothetical protein